MIQRHRDTPESKRARLRLLDHSREINRTASHRDKYLGGARDAAIKHIDSSARRIKDT